MEILRTKPVLTPPTGRCVGCHKPVQELYRCPMCKKHVCPACTRNVSPGPQHYGSDHLYPADEDDDGWLTQ